MRTSLLTRAALGLAASLAVALGCSSPSPRAPLDAQAVVPGVGEQIVVDQIVLVLDSSSSLRAAGRFEEGKALFESFAGAMPDGGYAASTLVFGGNEREALPLATFDRTRVEQAASQASYIGRSTPLPEVLEEVHEALEGSSGTAALVIFSDGLPTDAGRILPYHATLGPARDLVDGYKGALCIHTVQIGDSERGGGLLRRLANLTPCGSARILDETYSVAALDRFERQVFLGAAPPPAVAAAPPMDPDSDMDGVVDRNDFCPGTPLGAPVNSRGCWTVQGLLFAVDSSTIEVGYTHGLDELAGILKSNPELRVRLSGFTDSTGSVGYNQALSERRARAVKDYLVAEGISASRLETQGFGEEQPVASNDTAKGRRENRRTEVKVIR